MQTFLPDPDFATSAKTLDNKRLGKQRVETLQVLQVLLGERLITSRKVTLASGATKRVALDKKYWTRAPVTSKGWQNHPAVLMWRGHEAALMAYQEAVCEEWLARGFKDTCLEKTRYLLEPHKDSLGEGLPAFVGKESFHKSHKSNLIRKDPEFYRPQFPGVPGDLPYEWPTQKTLIAD